MVQTHRLSSINYLLSTCLLLLWGISRADEQNKTLDMAVKDRFLQEAPDRWEQYEERVQYLQGKQQLKRSLIEVDAAVEINGFAEWKANETSKLWIVDFEQKVNGKVKKYPTKALCVNSRYGFILERRKKESPWILADFVRGSLDSFIKRQFNKGYPEDNAKLITFQGVRLKDIIKRKEFQIIGCRTMTVDDEPLVEVAFDFDNKGIEEEFPFEGGKIVLDPHRFWCLRSYEARMKHPSFQGGSVFKVLELGETDDSFPWPKHVVVDSHFNDTKKIEDLQCELQMPATMPSEDEFKVSVFGLPEPMGLAKKRVSWHLWLALTGLLCLILAAFFRWQARRAKAKATP